MSRRLPPDLRAMVVVPARPGPLVALGDQDRGRDEIDDLVDDLFGSPDDRGPGPVDAGLLAGGIGAAAAAQTWAWPGIVTVLGVGAALLGAILPARWAWRRMSSAGRSARLRGQLGDGALLRTGSAPVAALLAAHARVLGAASVLAAAPADRAKAVAHAALLEVATLLDGRDPTDAAELEYVAARVRALDELADVVADPRVGDGEAERRRALVEARREVEAIAGTSSLDGAAALAQDLLEGHGG